MSSLRHLTERVRATVVAHPLAAAALIALALTLPTVTQPLLFDDHFHLAVCDAARHGDDGPRAAYLEGVRDAFGLVSLFEFFDGSDATHRAAMTTGAAPWWTVEGLRMSFWRPLTSYLELADHAVFGSWTAGYHLHSIAWYLVLIGAAWLVLRRALPRSTAALALLLFAVDESHHMPVDWIANRHALISGALGLAGLAAYVRWCRGGRWPWLAAALMALALALLGGESALGALAYAGAFALFQRGDPDGEGSGPSWVQRLALAAPVLVLTTAWAIVYQVQGFGASGSGSYIDPVATPVTYLDAAGPRLFVLLGDQLARLSADLATFVPALLPVLVIMGLVATIVVAALLRIAWPQLDPDERATLRWIVPGALVATIPSLSAAPAGRLLLLPSLGGAVVLAVLIRAGLRAREHRAELRGLARLQPAAAVTLLAMHLFSPPITWWISTAALTRISRDSTALAEDTAALLRDLGGDVEHVVLLAAPDAAVGIYLPMELYRMDLVFPDSWHVLSMAPHDLQVTRRDDRTLALSVVDGELLATMGETMGRDPDHPLAASDVVDLGSATVTVEAVGDRGPTQLAWRSVRPLNDPSLLLLQWRDGALKVFEPPPVGQTVTVPWSSGPLAM